MSLALETVAPWNVSIVDLACPAQVEMSVALLPRFENGHTQRPQQTLLELLDDGILSQLCRNRTIETCSDCRAPTGVRSGRYMRSPSTRFQR
jgi:hypothetical protein